MRAALSCVFSALLVISSAGRIRAERPNFVIILADDMGYGDASCYGGKAFETPHLDALARGGLRFTDFHSNGTVCSPTRAALLTGRYQQRASVGGVIFADPKQNRHHGLQLSETTFAEILRGAGYATGCFGKWHLGYERQYNPTAQGFDRFRGYVSGNIDYQSHFDRMGVFDWWHDGELQKEKGYSTHLITKHAARFIDDHHDKPFLAYIAHEAPHTPFQGPEDPAFRVEGKVVPERRDNAWRKRAYREMMQELDRGVGDVVKALRKHDIERKTLVFFLSDNGGTRWGSNGPLRGTKGTVWEGGHRVPAIASWPGTIEAGRTSSVLGMGFDLFPTMLALAKIDAPKDLALDGVNLSPVLMGKAERSFLSERTLYWQSGTQLAVRQGRWKLVLRAKGQKKARGGQLFDLAEDVGEARDLSARQPVQAKRLRELAQTWSVEVRRGATPQPEASTTSRSDSTK